ncbi:hypothetical protein [Dongshaea marina]|uniref:hypothetical protein n=1 Tax=Dongshaea marina TaxID=2047966 RepID=UPI00131F47F9|nr:hypothetical protein [Dongshaea marina]
MAEKTTAANHHQVKPVMVVYTAQMSGGVAYTDFEYDNLMKHFINLMLVSNTLENQGNSASSGSIVLNPDLLG